MDLGIADDGQCAGHKQEAQIAVTSFADTAEPVLAPARVLLRRLEPPYLSDRLRSTWSQPGASQQ
jgi:hypothetical protein